MVPVEIKQSYREGDIVGNRLTQPQAVHHVLWLDPTGPLSETSRIKLQLAGMHLLNANSLTELKLMLVRARMVVIRLVDDISLMTEVQELLRGLPRQLPLVCRVDANRLDLGMRAVRQGASDVLAADEWSEEVWARTLEALRTGLPPDSLACCQLWVSGCEVLQRCTGRLELLDHSHPQARRGFYLRN